MATKYVFCYSVNDLTQNSIIEKILADWVSKQDRKEWKERGFCPGVQNGTDSITFNFYVVTDTNLPFGQVNTVLDILRNQDAKYVSTHIVPRPAK